MPSPRQILTQNGHSGSFKVIYFDVAEETLCDYIAQYNNCGFRCGGSEDIAGKMRKSPFLTTPRSFEAPSPANPSEYPHKPYFARNCDPWATFLSLIVWIYLHSNYYGGLRKTCVWCNREHNSRSRSIQGHQMSLILLPIESAYAISY